MNTVVVGVDPGVNGGIAVLVNGKVRQCFKQGDGHAVKHAFEQAITLNDGDLPDVVAIEAVPKWCGEERFAVHMMTGSAMATMFGNFQLAVGVAIGMGIEPLQLVPVKWQNLVECRNRRDPVTREQLGTTAWKNKLKDRARQLHPEFGELTLWNSDAILIAHAGMLMLR